jgi:outer membrane protein OmpA-like peptidoglycan-associated protein/tetratricopeptide (TPR) repeat protein
MSAANTFAQTRFTLAQANKYYENYHYASAIPLYELWIERHPTDDAVLLKLADAYAKVNDSRKGEVAYQQLAERRKGDKEVILNYALMLARNGKYEKSEQYFQQYKDLGGDTRGERYVNALARVEKLSKDASSTTVQPVIFNSYQHDFSPAFYKKGLVFCSDRAERKQQIKRNTFDWNHSTFLDLYYVSDTLTVSKIKANKSAAKNKHVITSSLHSDYTYLTSNDTRTLGYYKKPVREDSVSLTGILMKFDETLNSKYHEGPLVFYKGEDSLVFTRNNYSHGKYATDKKGANRLKLYFAKRSSTGWTIKEFPYNSNEYSTGHPALSPDNQTLYFASDMPGGKGGTDIWFCQLKNKKWTAPQNLSAVNTEGNELFPFADDQGNLFLASDGWGGLGGLDVFYARLKDGTFDTPVNLGSPINSMKDDFGLIVNNNGKSGYFSSARNWEQSQDDIFSFQSKDKLVRNYRLTGIAREEGTNIVLDSAVVTLTGNQGKVIDKVVTGKDGVYHFVIDRDMQYQLHAEKNDYLPFSTLVQTQGMEASEPKVVNALLPKKGLYAISCIITDSKNGQTIDSVEFILKERRSRSVLTQSKGFAKGSFRLPLEEVKKGDIYDLQLELHAKGYLSKTVGYRAVFQDPGELKLHEVLDITLEKIDVGSDIGKLLNLKPIYFDLGKHKIRPDAAKELDKVVAVMRENPGMKIELGSHTDARGSDASNLSLSDRRAKASAAYIISQGISADRISGRGYGESKLVNQCGNGVKCSEADHQLNRRTEFIVVGL